MTFHAWTLLYIGAALFSAGVGIYLLHSEKKSLSRICLVSILFIMAAWPVFSFIASFVDDAEASELVIKLIFLILGFISVLFFLIPYSMGNEINNKILLLFIIPVISASIVLFAGEFAAVEYVPYGYHINYNIPAALAWSAIFIGTTAAGFYLFYKMYSNKHVGGELKIKIKYFCIGCGIALCTAFGLNVFLMILYDIPATGSIFTSIGVAIVFLCFRF